MDTAQTLLTGGNQTQQIQSVSSSAIWIAAIIAGAILLVAVMRRK